MRELTAIEREAARAICKAREEADARHSPVMICDQCRADVVRLVDGPVSDGGPRDWPEDFAHENGRYENRCVHCQQRFQGHKRRGVCRMCAEPLVDAPPLPEIGAGARSWMVYVIAGGTEPYTTYAREILEAVSARKDGGNG